MQGSGKPAECKPVTLSHNILSPPLHIYFPLEYVLFRFTSRKSHRVFYPTYLQLKCVEKCKQKGVQGAPLTAGINASYSTRYGCMINTLTPVQPSFPIPDKANVRSCFSRTCTNSVDTDTYLTGKGRRFDRANLTI